MSKKLLLAALSTTTAVLLIGGIALGQTSRFSDVNEDTHSWAIEAIEWAVDEGIIKGTSETTFSPDATLTRAQMVTILYRHNENTVDDILAASSILYCAVLHNDLNTDINLAVLSGASPPTDQKSQDALRDIAFDHAADRAQSDCEPPRGAIPYKERCEELANKWYPHLIYKCS